MEATITATSVGGFETDYTTLCGTVIYSLIPVIDTLTLSSSELTLLSTEPTDVTGVPIE